MTETIGKSIPRVDARSKVTGEARYPGDLVMNGMLHAKTLFAGRPHARILSIDPSRAKAIPGVVAVFTARDVPANERGLQIPDQPVLCGPGSDKPGAEIVRFVGDQVALVVAETEEIAARARALIRVEYEDLPVLCDPLAALKPGAYQIHAKRYLNPIHPELRDDGNRICHYQIRKGDVDAAWQFADFIVESDYRTPPQEHAYLQPEAGLAYIDDEGRVTVAVAGQWTTEDQHQIAHALGLGPEQVRVIYPAIGGAFGGREDISLQIVLALATWKLRRPVKMVWTREESILGHCKRHPFWIHSKWGADRGGKLVAAEIRIVADGGAYCYTTNKVLGNTIVTSTGVYTIPNVRVDIDGVYTNNPPGGAFRGFGSPQALFAAEMQMEKLASALGLDPLEFRLRNMFREGSVTSMGTGLPAAVSAVEVSERCALESGWARAGAQWRKPVIVCRDDRTCRGIGFAAGFKNVGYSFGYQDNICAGIELRGRSEIVEAIVSVGSAEVGQGTHTAILQMAAEALGISPSCVRLVVSDTATSPGSSGSCSASRMTLMAGNALRGAAEKALVHWRDGERPAVGVCTYLAPRTTTIDPVTGYGSPNFAYGYVAVAAEVEVDRESGGLRVLRVVCANDVGKAINPQQAAGQIEGGVVQALGWLTCENFQTAGGSVLTPNFSTYLIPSSSDVPETVKAVLVEKPDPVGPWGARGMGEMPFIVVAPAVMAAVHDATGIWFDEFPLTQELLLPKLTRSNGGSPQGTAPGGRSPF